MGWSFAQKLVALSAILAKKEKRQKEICCEILEVPLQQKNTV